MTSQRPPRPDRSTAFGLARLAYDLRYRRDRFRQALGILFLIVLTIYGEPEKELLVPGVVLAAIGELIRMWASGHIKKDKSLATDGPYGFVRHPLYVGNFLISIGFLMAANLLWGWIVFVLFWILFYPTTIAAEDHKLHGLFGDDWTAWRAKTRALIPRLTPYTGKLGGGWSFKQSLNVNGEPLIALFLAICLAVLHFRIGG